MLINRSLMYRGHNFRNFKLRIYRICGIRYIRGRDRRVKLQTSVYVHSIAHPTYSPRYYSLSYGKTFASRQEADAASEDRAPEPAIISSQRDTRYELSISAARISRRCRGGIAEDFSVRPFLFRQPRIKHKTARKHFLPCVIRIGPPVIYRQLFSPTGSIVFLRVGTIVSHRDFIGNCSFASADSKTRLPSTSIHYATARHNRLTALVLSGTTPHSKRQFTFAVASEVCARYVYSVIN